ncbi:unnamed protein product, partial [Allacma fusca]
MAFTVLKKNGIYGFE